MCNQQGQRPQQAFSLMELLVVITIISLLAALLMPVIGIVREAARTAACANNLRQLVMGVHAYALDWEVIPAASNWGQWRGGVQAAACLYCDMNNFGGAGNTNYNVLMCPSDKRPRGDVGWGPEYVQTVWAGGNTDSTFTRAWTSFSAGSMFWNNDSARYGSLSLIKPGSAMFWDSWRVQSEQPGGSDACGYNLHKAGMNIGFADGHAKWYSLTPLKPLEKWGLYFWDPNADVVDANGIHNVGRNYLPLFNDPYAEPW